MQTVMLHLFCELSRIECKFLLHQNIKNVVQTQKLSNDVDFQ